MPEHILVVEDDPQIADLLRRGLIYEGYSVAVAADGPAGLTAARDRPPDLVLLDLMLPGMDGLTVCARLRAASSVPILILTARDAVPDRVKGLDAGADDYLVKPFAPSELIARIHALLRRPSVTAQDEALSYAGLYLDPVTRDTRRGERSFELTSKEFDLLRYLMVHPRQVLRREQILQEVWGFDFGGDDNVLEVYVGYLRKKTEAGNEERLIQTVRGVGYVLREE